MVETKYPFHIAIIPDGNRRFAKRLMKKPWKGHEWGTEKLKKVLDWCRGTGVKMVTFYSLSLENIEKRPKREINFLYDISRKEMKDIIENDNNFIHEHKARIKCFGRLEVLPQDIRELIKGMEERTKDYDNYHLNLALAYGGKQEIIDAVKKMADEASKGDLSPEMITEEYLEDNLYTKEIPDPDMIIRTGGEKRLSNFLPIQSAYSELFFINTLWPELSEKEFSDALEEYAKRKRRFGA